MAVPNRPSILISAALAVCTPLVGGAMAWRLLDEDGRGGLVYLLVYWPSILLDALPGVVADAFTVSALPTVLLYFGGYLLLCQGVRASWKWLAA